MNSNGENEWNVSFSRITFLQRILDTHTNVAVLSRHDDIVFEILRIRQQDRLTIVCVDPYTASLELVMRIVHAFPEVKVIFIGGKWAGSTKEAYEFCQERRIGIYNAGEIAGGLSKDIYWNYEKIDDEGNSTKSVRA